MSKKIFVAVDVRSMWEVCLRMFGNKAKLDYRKLRDKLISLCDNGSIIESTAYFPFVESSKISSFYSFLKLIGFNVFEKHILPKHKSYFNIDMDIEITTDILCRGFNKEYDTLIIVTNDFNYQYLFSTLKNIVENISIFIVCFKDESMERYSSICHKLIYLTKDFVIDGRI